MNPVLRRRLPPSVRSLLTDIGPKQEWTEPEDEPAARDGILLPSRGAAQEESITPAKTKEQEEGGGSATKKSSVCMLCQRKPSCYTCPRCNVQYCSLACYQSPDHTVCSEEFYKESVLQELKEMGKTEAEGKKKMQEILVGLKQKAEETHGGMESLLKQAGVVQDDEEDRDVTKKVQAMELLSRLAEHQESGEERETEIDAILEQLEEIGGGELLSGDPEEDEGEQDLADRLSGLDIDKLSEEELWALLSTKERETFTGLVKDGALGGLIPLWKPWWEEHEEGERLVEELSELEKEKSAVTDLQDSNDDVQPLDKVIQEQDKSVTNVKEVKTGSRKEKTKLNVPKISAKIPKLTSLCASPSPLVCYGVINALFGYAFTLSLFNGDTDSLMFEFCDMVLALSESLSSNRVFSSIQEALDCGEARILGGSYLDKEDPLAPARTVEAVAHIMTGRDRKDVSGYCLAALSQLRSVLSKARTALSKEGEEGAKRQKFYLASKKCEFFQAWVLDNGHEFHRLAVELWSEHSRREAVKKNMEKEKTLLEQNLKKQRKKGKLIEEVS
ncbi:zinc finger HIT domain-containing protein 2 [Salarias fasciatus]|uniref:HIT-type domain-containing protein n=1 Tax=Salarias fasciatus TaxID=181472 RepID=A0A672JS96_SALFA|nr:zinc finger HIT domain-containing protein 2 [Salarias fasciatus]